ncbi:MAG: GAF domain-containing protein, partial [Proteobacteria bacterium]|nr:GAF domain-containing protein [Pseudomonadota bacterium]
MKNLKKLALTTKVSITIIILLILLFITSITSLIGINDIGYEIEEIAEEDIPLAKIFTHITISQLKQTIWFERALSFSKDKDRERFNESKEAFFELNKIIDDYFNQGETITTEILDSSTLSSRAIKEANKISIFLANTKQKHHEYIVQIQEVFDLLNTKQVDEISSLVKTIKTSEDILSNELNKSLMQIEKFTEISTITAEQHEKDTLLTVLIVTILALLFGSINGISIVRTITKFINQINEVTAKNKQDDWLKTGQAQLNETTSGEQEITKLTKNIISFLTTYIEAQVGLFYLVKSDNKLQIIANYAYTISEHTPTEFNFGESLVGQAALEQKVISVTQTSAECPLIIRSGLTGALPHHILLLPFLYENELKGIIEIGSADEITDSQRIFLEQAMLNIGIAINTAESRTKMQVLLKQSQQQSEELQLKQKEMQQSNEELQSQSEELQSQSEEMQSQQEELRQTNEILEERTRGLEQQKAETQEKNRTLEINRTEMEQIQVEMEKTQAAITLKAEELELASKYKSEFLANMSHELRTPLNSLLILAQLLVDNKPGTLNEKQIEYAKTINSAGNDLLTLINDILDLSKVEAGKIEVQWENISLPNFLTIIEQKFVPIADNKELKFITTIDADVNPTQRTDGQRLKQIINNLLSNAFKFTSEGSIKITVKHPVEIPINIGGQQLELDKTIAISVIDSGIGIPKDKQQAIFEAYQEADGSTSRKYGGTGLGLSISRQLARLL